MIPHTEAGKGGYAETLRRDYAERRARLYGTPTRDASQIRPPAPPTPAQPPPVAAPRPVFGNDMVVPLPSPSAWRAIVSEVCISHGVTYLELCSVRRALRLVAARHEAAYRLSQETAMSLPEIGRHLGGRDHSTIVYAIRRHEAKLRGEVYRHPARAVAQRTAP